MLTIRIIQFISFRYRIISTKNKLSHPGAPKGVILLGFCAVLALASLFFMPDHSYGGDTGWGGCVCGHTIRGGNEDCRRHLCKVHGRYCSSGGSSKTGRSGSSGLSTKRAIGAAVGQAIGQAIVKGLFSSSPRRDVYAEHQAELERQRRRVAECETRKARSIAFDRDKADTLSQMKDLDDDDLGLKLEDDDGASMDFKTYHTDESIRRDILDGIRGDKKHKELYGWCVLHTPLRPTAPPHDGINCDYEIRLERFYERRNNWEAKCDQERGSGGGGGSGASTEDVLTFKPMETGTEETLNEKIMGMGKPFNLRRPPKQPGPGASEDEWESYKNELEKFLREKKEYENKLQLYAKEVRRLEQENGTKKEETSKVLGKNTPYYSKENGTKKKETSKKETPLMKAIKCSDCSLIRRRTSTGCRAKFDKTSYSKTFHKCIVDSNAEAVKCEKRLCP